MRTSLFRIIAFTALLGACDRNAGDSADRANLPCAGNASGGMGFNDRSRITYSVSFRRDSSGTDVLDLKAIFVGRGQPGWERLVGSAPPVRPTLPESAGPIAGASLGTLFMGYERKTGVAWVHDQKVVLDTFNVLLVDRIDTIGGPPVVTGKLRLPHIALAPGLCARRAQIGNAEWTDTLRAVLLRRPEIRSFIGG